jgi:hypothetical protein
MIAVTQKLPNNKSFTVYFNPDNIEKVMPWNNGALIIGVSGLDTETVETADEILKKMNGD